MVFRYSANMSASRALDAQTKILMGYELVRLWTDHRKSVVFVTHWMRSGCPIASWS